MLVPVHARTANTFATAVVDDNLFEDAQSSEEVAKDKSFERSPLLLFPFARRTNSVNSRERYVNREVFIIANGD